MRVTIGADPELFLVDMDGRHISAIGQIGGSKDKPRLIGQDCSVQEDGVAVEFGFSPAETADQFVNRCNYALEYLTNHALERGLFLNVKASVTFHPDELRHPSAQVSGCDPDYNVWTGAENPRPPLKKSGLRAAGGHVHIGVDDENLDRTLLVKWCDICLGLHSVLEDEDTERKKLYGRAGAFRPKPYGVEYRSLSNYWIRSPELMRKVFTRAKLAVERTQYNWGVDDDSEAIQNAINNNDKKEADRLIGQFGVQ